MHNKISPAHLPPGTHSDEAKGCNLHHEATIDDTGGGLGFDFDELEAAFDATLSTTGGGLGFDFDEKEALPLHKQGRHDPKFVATEGLFDFDEIEAMDHDGILPSSNMVEPPPATGLSQMQEKAIDQDETLRVSNLAESPPAAGLSKAEDKVNAPAPNSIASAEAAAAEAEEEAFRRTATFDFDALDKLEEKASAPPTPKQGAKQPDQPESAVGRRCLQCRNSSSRGRMGQVHTEFAGKWYCDDCWEVWEKAERSVNGPQSAGFHTRKSHAADGKGDQGRTPSVEAVAAQPTVQPGVAERPTTEQPLSTPPQSVDIESSRNPQAVQELPNPALAVEIRQEQELGQDQMQKQELKQEQEKGPPDQTLPTSNPTVTHPAQPHSLSLPTPPVEQREDASTMLGKAAPEAAPAAASQVPEATHGMELGQQDLRVRGGSKGGATRGTSADTQVVVPLLPPPPKPVVQPLVSGGHVEAKALAPSARKPEIKLGMPPPETGEKCARVGCSFQRHPALAHGHCCNYCRDGKPHGPNCQRKLYTAGSRGAVVPVPSQVSAAPRPTLQGPADASANTVSPAAQEKLRVAYWGIVDIKYDPRLPENRRISVLELGDGQTSGFSQHGKPIRIRFENGYTMDPQPLRCAVLVENKKVTHDRFVREGFQHLRPPAACYPRRYSPDLANKILMDLGLRAGAGSGAAVVLKLCNRSRGAGVVVAPILKLDKVLMQLLTPPTGQGLQEHLMRSPEDVLKRGFKEAFEESLLHWWSNECPFFIAESCCHSVPITPDSSGQSYDGTMRVSFVIRRKAPYSSLEDNPLADLSKLYEVDWLGGYWKLPRTPLTSGSGVGKKAAEESLEHVLARTVSSFNSADKLTAEVSPSHLAEVCKALSGALPQVFKTSALHREQLLQEYGSKEPLFAAFVLARLSASVRGSRMATARDTLQMARSLLPKQVVPGNSSLGDLAARAASSYVERNEAVCFAIQKAWDAALASVEKAIRSLPTNSSAHYMKGVVLQEREETAEASTCMVRSILFDPDFKYPYITLGSLLLLLSRFEDAAEASRACLRRHPDSPAAHLNRGQALYHWLYGKIEGKQSTADLCKEAAEALRISKEKVPDQWQPSHEGMLTYFLSNPDERGKLPRQKLCTWGVLTWRP